MDRDVARLFFKSAVLALLAGAEDQEEVIDYVVEHTSGMKQDTQRHLVEALVKARWGEIGRSAEEAEEDLEESVTNNFSPAPYPTEDKAKDIKHKKNTEEEQKRLEEDLLRMRQDQEIPIQEIVDRD